MCVGHMMHMKHMKFGRGFRNSFHRRVLLPPLRRSPSLEEGGLGGSPVKACGLAVDWI